MQLLIESTISGAVSAVDRKEIFSKLENTSEINCLIGQIGTMGIGFEARGVSKVILIDTPKTVSIFRQLIGRTKRLITEANAHLACEKVDVILMQPEIAPEVIAGLSTEQQKYLKHGTIFKKWQQRLLERYYEYSLLLNNNSTLTASNSNCVSDVVLSLAKVRTELEEKRKNFKLLRDQDLGKIYLRYNTAIKRAWREDHLSKFVIEHLPIIGVGSKLRVATLPGPQGLEIDVYKNAKIPVHSIYAFENSETKAEQSLFRQEAHCRGVAYYSSSIESILPKLEPFDVISIDTHSYLQVSILEMLIGIKNQNSFMLLKNSLMQRESGTANELLEAVNNDRYLLDLRMIQLAGSNLKNELGFSSVIETIHFCEKAELFAQSLAKKINPRNQVQFAEALTILILNSPTIRSHKQFKYKTPGGSPFLSTFCVLEPMATKVLSPELFALREVLINQIQNGNYKKFNIKTLESLIDEKEKLAQKLSSLLTPIKRSLTAEYLISELKNSTGIELLI